MKKNIIFSLSLLILGANIQPACAMSGGTALQKEIDQARMHGIKAGIATGFLTGLAGGGLAQNGMLRFLAFNTFVPELVNKYVKPGKYQSYGNARATKITATMDRWHFWTDVAVSSTLIAAMASGAIMSFSGMSAHGEKNSAANFGKIILPTFALVAGSKYLSHRLYKAVGFDNIL